MQFFHTLDYSLLDYTTRSWGGQTIEKYISTWRKVEKSKKNVGFFVFSFASGFHGCGH